MLIVFGLAATQASRVNWRELGDEINMDQNDCRGWPSWFGHCYSYDDQLQQEFPAGSTLRVVSNRGAVTVTPSDDNQIRVVVRKRVSARDQSDADKWNAGTKPQITTSGNILILNANTEGAGDHWIATDMDVSIPRKASVVISARRGNVSVTGRDGDTEVSGQHSEVSLSDINGKANVNLDGGSVRISAISSDVAIQGRGGEVETDFAELKIASGGDQASAAGTVGTGGPRLVINNEHGSIEIRKGSAVAETAPPKAPKPPREPQAPVEPTEN